jgi:hypothetical protein
MLYRGVIYVLELAIIVVIYECADTVRICVEDPRHRMYLLVLGFSGLPLIVVGAALFGMLRTYSDRLHRWEIRFGYFMVALALVPLPLYGVLSRLI